MKILTKEEEQAHYKYVTCFYTCARARTARRELQPANNAVVQQLRVACWAAL